MTAKIRISALLLALALVLPMAARSYKPADIPNVQLEDSTRLVSNPDGILSAEAEKQINEQLLDIRRKTTAEVAFVAIDQMDESYNGDIDRFATELFDLWRPGKADVDNGVLFLVAKDDRRYVIRTGYGAEGIVPDVIAGRIGRHIIQPAFKEGDYDGGMVKTARELNRIITDPEVRAELLSADKDDDSFDWMSLLTAYLVLSMIITVCVGGYALLTYLGVRGKDRYDKYLALRSTAKISKYLSFVALGLPLIVWLPLRAALHRWRDGRHVCRNCGHDMEKLDEEHDNDHLTPAQDTEERINSVDYDVWLCPHCGEKDVYQFVNPDSNFTVCPHCHARACRLSCDRVIAQPTTQREGYGVKEYSCLNCNRRSQIPYRIAKLAAAPPVMIFPGGGRGGGGFGGGGFGGGSFGGGMTGGGGASGGW